MTPHRQSSLKCRRLTRSREMWMDEILPGPTGMEGTGQSLFILLM